VNVTISPQIRVVALVGLLAAIGLGGSMMLLGRGGSSKTETAPTSLSTRPSHTTPDKTSTTASKPTKPAAHATKPASKPHARKTAKSNAFRGNKVYATLPHALQWQLAHHKVVVVSIYNPRSDVDAITVAEAHQGAVDAGVGFLLVSVLDNKVAGILTALLPNGGLLPNPGVLVYRAPGDIALRLDGFADRASVAQAATNAMNGETGPAPANALSSAPAATTATAAPAPTVTP
jgi:hypothetical protein